MSNAVAIRADLPPALQMDENELLSVLQSSLYPGAKLESIKLVVSYCRAGGLDPMQKPVHIVPMKVSTGQKDANGWDIKETRDVIMPGVGLYRTQAARTNAYAGVSDPEFGPTKTLTFTSEHWEGEQGHRRKVRREETLEYPEWCRVSVTRIVNGLPCVFTARELWMENYATKSADSTEPNAMWKKRPFGQIAKCAEAQALRKAFPEQTGSQPTAEEMEGKSLDVDENGQVLNDPPATGRKPVVSMPQARAPRPDTSNATDATLKGETAADAPAAPREPNTALASEGERNYILNRAKRANVEMAQLMEAAGITGLPADLSGLTKDGFIALKDALPK